MIAALNGRGLDFQVFYDLEWSNQRKLGKQAVENIAVAFLTRMKKAGYKVGIYCNLDWYNNVLTDALRKYECWIAHYPDPDNGTIQTRVKPKAGIGWQYSSKGKVSGISGNVDMDVFYKDYRGTTQKGETTVVKTKLQKFLELGDYYASNGGYLEMKSDAYLDDFKKNAGYNNYTRFARDVNSWGSRVARLSHGVQSISSGSWLRFWESQEHCKSRQEQWNMAQITKNRCVDYIP